MSSDFGVHPALAADLIEVLGPAGRAGYAAEQLGGWMAHEPREADPALFGSGRAYVQPQPKGVVGNIVPWNFPVRPLGRPAGRDARRRQSRRDQALGVHAGLRRAAARDGARDVRPRPGRRRPRRPGAGPRVHARALGSPPLHGQPGDRARDRQGGGRAARAGDARAGRQVPGDPHRGQRRRRVGQAGARAPRRSRTGRCASRSTIASCPRERLEEFAAPGGRLRARVDARLLPVGQLHRDHLEPPPRADPGPAAGRAGARLRRAARSRRPATSIRPPASCRCRSSSTRRTTSP